LATILQRDSQEAPMHAHSLIRFTLFGCVIACVAAGCNRKSAGPELQVTTTNAEARSEPVQVSGCLRAGLAENTFVLITNAESGTDQPATYQLNGHAVPLRDYVGQRVNVSGTIRSEEHVATTGVAAAKPAKGSSGTPIVETTAELDIRQLNVTGVNPTGDRCAAALPPEDQPARRIK
jgi:hypothetical protein